MPLLYPITILSPVTNESVNLWNVPNMFFGSFHKFSNLMHQMVRYTEQSEKTLLETAKKLLKGLS